MGNSGIVARRDLLQLVREQFASGISVSTSRLSSWLATFARRLVADRAPLKNGDRCVFATDFAIPEMRDLDRLRAWTFLVNNQLTFKIRLAGPISAARFTGRTNIIESDAMSLRCCLQFVLGITLAFALVGCAYTDQFSGRAETFGDVAAKARDTMVFTNIIRASRGEPLSFVSIGTINGVSSAQTTVGLPPVIFGPHFTAAQGLANHVMQSQTVFGANAGGGSGFVGNSLNSATSTNFQVTPVETKEFYQGLLHNVDPRILQLFIEQGIARELLFYLFTDRVILTTPTEKTEFRNDPLDPHFERFQHFVKLAMDYGLTSEPRPQQDKPRPEKAGGHEGPESWQLCFSDIYRVKGLPETGDAPRCDGKANSPEERTVQFRTENGRGPIAKLTVLPRSPFGIFQYLGRIAAMGERGHIFLQSAAAVDAPPFRDEILFDIVSAAPGEAIDGGCYLDLTFNGATYCVPNRAINTKRIFGLLTQLIALNTALGDVPVTPTVRVVQ